VVTFAGPVGGKGVVVITHPNGLRSSLEPVIDPVSAGTPVAAAMPVGTLGTWPGGQNADHCTGAAAPGGFDACLHWGVRRGEVYLDPLTLLDAEPPIILLPPVRAG
jgi:hypothetical protein